MLSETTVGRCKERLRVLLGEDVPHYHDVMRDRPMVDTLDFTMRVHDRRLADAEWELRAELEPERRADGAEEQGDASRVGTPRCLVTGSSAPSRGMDYDVTTCGGSSAPSRGMDYDVMTCGGSSAAPRRGMDYDGEHLPSSGSQTHRAHAALTGRAADLPPLHAVAAASAAPSPRFRLREAHPPSMSMATSLSPRPSPAPRRLPANALPAPLQAAYEASITHEHSQFDARTKRVLSRLHQRIAKRPNSPRLHDMCLAAHFETYSNRVNPPVRPVVPKKSEPPGRKRYPRTMHGASGGHAGGANGPDAGGPNGAAQQHSDSNGPAAASSSSSKPPDKAKTARLIWLSRAKWCDSKSLFDTEAVEARRFQNFWNDALELGLGKLILKRDDDGDASEIDEVKAVLWGSHALLTQLFDFYACSSGMLSEISQNSFLDMVDDLELKDNEYCRGGDLDTLFIAVNTLSKLREKERAKVPNAPAAVVKEDVKALNRVELLYILVSIAINKFVLTSRVSDVSEAMHLLLAEWIGPRVDARVFAEYNIFRAKCYELSVSAVLLKHESSLRRLFNVAAAGSCESVQQSQLMNLAEYKTLLRALRLIGDDVTERDALYATRRLEPATGGAALTPVLCSSATVDRLCFSLSRMAVVDGRSLKGFAKENNLPFEGFLEALCRLSMLKALPTDDELAVTGCAHAGVFMARLHAGSLPEEFTDAIRGDGAGASFGDEAKRFISERAANWGEELKAHTLDAALRHLISCILHEIEDNTMGEDNLVLTEEEVRAWAKKNKVGGTGAM